jgi:hypothetical protein
MAGEPVFPVDALAKLREPFPEHQVSIKCQPYKKDSPKGRCEKCGGYHGLPALPLSYVGHAALTDRLLDVDPFWSWEPLAMDAAGLPLRDANGGLWIKLTVCGVSRLGYGDADGKAGGNAIKECIGDALRNAAMRFGAALDLWHKGILHLDEDDEPDKEPEAKPKAENPEPENAWNTESLEEFSTHMDEIYQAMKGAGKSEEDYNTQSKKWGDRRRTMPPGKVLPGLREFSAKVKEAAAKVQLPLDKAL